MVFAEFQKHSTGWNGTDFSGPVEVIPMLGSDGVYILDGRKSIGNQIRDAHKRVEALRGIHGDKIVGFKLFIGESFTNCRPLVNGQMIPVTPAVVV